MAHVLLYLPGALLMSLPRAVVDLLLLASTQRLHMAVSINWVLLFCGCSYIQDPTIWGLCIDHNATWSLLVGRC